MLSRRGKGVYVGRLVVRDGILCADEGPHAGEPVYHDVDRGAYLFVPDGEPTHNERHELRPLALEFTTAEGHGQGDPAQAHHHGVQPGDDHFDPRGRPTGRGGFTHIRMRQHSDRLGPTVTGHTDAYTGGGNA